MADQDIYRFTISAASAGELSEFLRGNRLDLGCRAIVRRREGRFSVDAFADETEMTTFTRSRAIPGLTVERRENMSSQARAAKAEMTHGNRFAAQSSVPRGLGVKE
jgi:hypothetical protein